MAGRFLFQKFASQMSRSTSLLGAHASAPVTRRASESGIRIIHNLFSGASAYPRTPFLNIEGIHGSTARYLSAFSCIRATSKRSSPPKFLPPVITSSKKAAVVDYVRVNRHFSTSPSTKDTDSLEQYLSALGPEWQAKLEAARAERAAQDAEWKARDADFNRYVTMMATTMERICIRTWVQGEAVRLWRGGFGMYMERMTDPRAGAISHDHGSPPQMCLTKC